MTVAEGVDYAWNGPSATALKATGKKFACRYGGPGSAGKQLTAGELAKLKAAGLSVVANAEGAAGGFSSYTAGASWAREALDHFNALGMPDDRPIYFSVDWDAGAADWASIDSACRGAASVIGPSRVGVYGGYNTIAHCASAGMARWFWQTYAWSGGKWHPAAHIQQYHNGVSIGGADCDLNRAMVADYGQWGGVNDVFTNADKTWLTGQITAIVQKQVAAAFADYSTGWSDGYPGRTDDQHKNDLQVMRNFLFGKPDAKGQQVPPDAPVAVIAQAAAKIMQAGQ